jgi:hypothetical protein
MVTTELPEIWQRSAGTFDFVRPIDKTLFASIPELFGMEGKTKGSRCTLQGNAVEAFKPAND